MVQVTQAWSAEAHLSNARYVLAEQANAETKEFFKETLAKIEEAIAQLEKDLKKPIPKPE
jgi:protein subunit release factor A